MGMYQDIQFEADLNDLGLEIWADLTETQSWKATAERMSYYPFLEHVERAGKWISPITTWPGVTLNGSRLTVDTTKTSALKDRGGDWVHLLRTFLAPLVNKPFEVVLTHEVSRRRVFRVEPVVVKLDWDRRYGDPTGI